MRRIVTVFAFFLCTGAAAAYAGGFSLQSIAHKEAKYHGDAHAAITRIETVRIWGTRQGHARWAMIRMKGPHAFRVGCPRPGPGVPGPCGAHYLEVGVDLANHKVGLDWGLTASEVSAIAKARKASHWLRIFPDTPALYVQCAIQRGGLQLRPNRPLTGTCSTVATPSNHVRRVEFVQTWRLPPSSRLNKASWIVTLGRHGRIKSIRVTGEPPQLWK